MAWAFHAAVPLSSGGGWVSCAGHCGATDHLHLKRLGRVWRTRDRWRMGASTNPAWRHLRDGLKNPLRVALEVRIRSRNGRDSHPSWCGTGRRPPRSSCAPSWRLVKPNAWINSKTQYGARPDATMEEVWKPASPPRLATKTDSLALAELYFWPEIRSPLNSRNENALDGLARRKSRKYRRLKSPGKGRSGLIRIWCDQKPATCQERHCYHGECSKWTLSPRQGAQNNGSVPRSRGPRSNPWRNEEQRPLRYRQWVGSHFYNFSKAPRCRNLAAVEHHALEQRCRGNLGRYNP